jgi:hypothetical protein
MRHVLHVVDLDAAHGVQWPPLLQAITERTYSPVVWITGVGTDRDLLHRSGTGFTPDSAGVETVKREVGEGDDDSEIPPL